MPNRRNDEKSRTLQIIALKVRPRTRCHTKKRPAKFVNNTNSGAISTGWNPGVYTGKNPDNKHPL